MFGKMFDVWNDKMTKCLNFLCIFFLNFRGEIFSVVELVVISLTCIDVAKSVAILIVISLFELNVT